MAKTHLGLSDADDIRDAADLLSDFADAGDAWIQDSFDAKEITQAQAFEAFTSNGRVRSQANILYIDAVKSVVANLQESQAGVRSTINSGKAALKKIDSFKKFIDLVADMLVLVGAIYAGKPGPVIAALKEIRKDAAEANTNASTANS